MPGGDRTGPMGQGSMTGRLLGFCTSNKWSGGAFSRIGGGFGMGRGMGFRGNSPYFTGSYTENYNSETEVEILNRQAIGLKDNLNQIEERLSQLKEESNKEKEK